MEDKSLTARTYVGFARDKGWIFRTFIGQMLDNDKVKTNARRILDKCLTKDKGWTKVGIPTLGTSTEEEEDEAQTVPLRKEKGFAP